VERNRNTQGLTLQEIANRLGIKGRSAIKQYETGKHDPSFAKAQQL
jgi:transcriptional regulator with XRE-family HTH domain